MLVAFGAYITSPTASYGGPFSLPIFGLPSYDMHLRSRGTKVRKRHYLDNFKHTEFYNKVYDYIFNLYIQVQNE